MNAAEERTRSIWMDVEPLRAAPLTEVVEADVVVVGAGIAGLSIAYELLKAGQSVVVLDRGAVGGGMTSRTSGHLSFELDDYYHVLIKQRGEDEARQYYASQSAAVDRIEEIAREEGIDCDFARVDAYIIAAGADDRDTLDSELEACRKIDFAGVAMADSAPLTGTDTGACLRFPNQARFHPMKYVRGLAEAVQRLGGRIHGDTAVTEFASEDGTPKITLENGVVLRPKKAVAAANSPLGVGLPFHAKHAPYRTLALAAKTPKGSAADILLWDTANPYNYVRIQPGESEDLLIVGGQDYKSGRADDAPARFAALEDWARARYPEMGEVTHRWSGQVFEPADHVPSIGLLPGETTLFLVTSDSGEGLTSGVAASLVLRDMVGGWGSPWSEVYDPSRAPTGVSAVTEFFKENFTVAANMVEHVTGGEVKDESEISPGQGAVMRQDGKKVAAFRDDEGTLHLRSAVCTHAGCIVHFNTLERCWDCPCHGSQFGVDGAVLSGPATKPLEEVDATASA